MALVTVQGEKASLIWEMVEPYQDYLELLPEIERLMGDDRKNAEIGLCAFMASILYGVIHGKNDLHRHGWPDYLSYYRELWRETQNSCIRLSISNREQHKIILHTNKTIKISLDLKHIEGVTTVIPISSIGYSSFMDTTFRPLELPRLPECLASPDSKDTYNGGYLFLYLGAFFNVAHMDFLGPADINVTERASNLGPRLMISLFQHIADMLPRLRVTDFGVTYAGQPMRIMGAEPNLPILCCATQNENVLGKKLIETAGFRLAEKQGGNPSYILPLSDLNQRNLSADETLRISMARKKLYLMLLWKS